MATLAELLALLPDNTTGQIDAADVRAVVSGIFERFDATTPIEAQSFDTTPPPSVYEAGRVHWDTDHGTLEVDTSTDGVSIAVGYDALLDGNNDFGGDISKGQPVRAFGIDSTGMIIRGDNGEGGILGVAAHDIPVGTTGKILTSGLITGIDTSAFVGFSEIYSNGSGQYTNSLSSSYIGRVLSVDPVNGVLLVRPERRTSGFGTTPQRPLNLTTGYMFYDISITRPVFFNGTGWIFADGTAA